jgi:ubiquinone/menaquinone biosynthesis C-methylase UbiE
MEYKGVNTDSKNNAQFARYLKLHTKYFGSRPKGPILEFGAGKGDFLISASNNGLTVHGVEVDAIRAAEFKRNCGEDLPRYKPFYSLYDGTVLPFNNRHFNGVYSWFVLEHVEDIYTSLREIVRVSKPGGSIFLFFQDARDCYEGHCDLPWPPFLPKQFFAPYLAAFGASEREIEFMGRDVFYVTTPLVCSVLEWLGCKILYESRSALPKMLSGIDIASEEEAFAYGTQVRSQVESGNWERAPENGIVVAERTSDDSRLGLLSGSAVAQAEPRTFSEFAIKPYGQTKSPAPVPTAKSQDDPATDQTKPPEVDFETVERARRSFSKDMQRYMAQGGEYLDPAPLLKKTHLANCQILTDRYELLEHLPKQAVVVEVGTDKGAFAKEIYQRTSPRELHLIDIELERLDERNITEARESGALTLHGGDSSSVLRSFDDRYFDWIYIDADHRYAGVKKDIKVAAKKVKTDGLLVLNDYTVWSPQTMMHCGVMRAVNEFCLVEGWELVFLAFQSLMYNDVVIRKIAT